MKNEICETNENDEMRRCEQQLRHETDRGAVALFIMLFVGLLTSAVSVFTDEIIQALPTAAQGSATLAFNMLYYALYLGVPTVYLAHGTGDHNHNRIGINKNIGKHPIAAVSFCSGAMYFGNVLAGYLQTLLSSVNITVAQSSQQSVNGVFETVLLYISSALFPALLEEILVRGYILGGMNRYNRGFAVITSSVFFALMHLSPLQNLFALIAGLAMGYFVSENNSLTVSIIAHFLNNAFAVTKNILNANADENVYFAVSLVIDIAVFAFAAVSVFILFKNRKCDFEKEKAPFIVSIPALAYIVTALAISFLQISFVSR